MVTAVGTVLADVVQKVAEFAPQIIEAGTLQYPEYRLRPLQ